MGRQAGGGSRLYHVVFVVCARCFGHHVFAPLSRHVLDRVFCLAHLAKRVYVLAHLTKHFFRFRLSFGNMFLFLAHFRKREVLFGSPWEAFLFFGSHLRKRVFFFFFFVLFEHLLALLGSLLASLVSGPVLAFYLAPSTCAG